MTEKEDAQAMFFKENDIEDTEFNRLLFQPVPRDQFNKILKDLGYDDIIADEKSRELFKNLPSITTNRPDVYEIDNTKVVKNLTTFTEELTAEVEGRQTNSEIIQYDVVVNAHHNKKKYVVKVEIDMESVVRSERHKQSKSLNAFDMEVHNAICTLISAGNTAMTIDTIYRTMNGFIGRERAPVAQRDAIDTSLDKMKKITVNADFTDHYKMQGLEGISLKAKEGTMIDYVLEHTILNGQETKTYKFSRLPIFYEYSRDMDQIQKIPIEKLNLQGYMRMDQVKTVIKNYLLSRIEDMKYRHNRGNLYQCKNGRLNESPARIRYIHIQEMLQRIYESNGKKFTNRTWNDRRRNLTQILDAFVKKGDIYYYEELKDNGKFSKVQIYFDDEHMTKELKQERRSLHPELYEQN